MARVGIVPDNDDNQLDQKSQLIMLTNATQHLKFEGKFKKDTAKKKKERERALKKNMVTTEDGCLLSF